MPPRRVRCADCGFLALRRMRDDELVHAPLEMRQSGQPPHAMDIGEPRYDYLPICLELAIDLPTLIKARVTPEKFVSRPSHRPDWIAMAHTLDEIQVERDCQRWVQWRQGSTPKEHREMMDRERMLEWQAAREDADRQWREQESSRNERLRRFELKLVLIGVAISVFAVLAGVGATIAGAFIERGGEPRVEIVVPPGTTTTTVAPDVQATSAPIQSTFGTATPQP